LIVIFHTKSSIVIILLVSDTVDLLFLWYRCTVKLFVHLDFLAILNRSTRFVYNHMTFFVGYIFADHFDFGFGMCSACSKKTQNAQGIKYFFHVNYLSGKSGCTGAGFPELDMATGAAEPNAGVGTGVVTPAEEELVDPVVVAPKPVFPPKTGAGAADPDPLAAALNPAADTLGVVAPLENPVIGAVDDVCNPPLLAPFSFSCVRPHAANPSTAPMATWNSPAP
jgi:hypothetical protein